MFCTSAFMFCPNGTAFAQEAVELPAPGITPDSPLYFLDELAEQVALTFTFSEEARVQKALQYAEERLAEMNSMVARNDFRATIRAMNGYANCLNLTLRAMETLGNDGQHVSEMVALAMAKHAAVFDDVAGGIPEEAREIMTQTRERVCICQQTALRLVAQGDPERANEIRIMLTERQRNSIRVMAGEEEGARFQDDSQETAVPADQDTGQPAILDQGPNEEQPRLGQENQAQVGVNSQHMVTSRLRQNSMFGEPPGVTPAGNENPENDRQKVPAQ